MPVGGSFVVTYLLLYLQVLCSVEIPIGILPAAMDSLVQDIAILFLHSVFAPVVPLVLVQAEAVGGAAHFISEHVVGWGL